MKLAPGEIKKWGEHLDSKATTIYFLASKPR
jgi:hypothetical protein